MTGSSPIANLVRALLADGVAHDQIVRAVEASEKQLALRQNGNASRGTRLSADWTPSQEHIAYAKAQGMTAEQIAIEAEKFKNYWIAKSGNSATKRDWLATWRNWILTAMEQRHAANRRFTHSIGDALAARHSPTGANAVLAGMGRLVRRLGEDRDAAGRGHGEMASSPDAPRLLGFDPEST